MGWTTVTTRYEPIKLYADKSLPCPVCGKKAKRQRTFEMTLNPFNKNPDGTVRDRKDIWQALKAQADIWRGQPETHAKCEVTS